MIYHKPEGLLSPKMKPKAQHPEPRCILPSRYNLRCRTHDPLSFGRSRLLSARVPNSSMVIIIIMS